MATDLNSMLGAFKADSYAVRLSSGVASILPFCDEIRFVASVEDAAKRADEDNWEAIAKRTHELADELGPRSALKTANFLDMSDKGIALYSGVQGVVRATKKQEGALETDPQQLADAALKALGLAWMGWRLYDGTAAEKANRLWSQPAARALVGYYVAVDVALPFTDNILSSGGAFFAEVINKAAEENAERLAPVGDAGKALEFFRSIKDKLGELSTRAAKSVKPITEMAAERLPKIMSGVDAVAGVVATAADTLDVYRYLGAQMVLEQCLAQATAEVQEKVRAEAEAKRVAEEAARAAAEAKRAASGVKKDYALEEGLAASSLDHNPIKVTRSGGDELPEKKSGCGCLGLILLFLTLGGLAVQAVPEIAHAGGVTLPVDLSGVAVTQSP